MLRLKFNVEKLIKAEELDRECLLSYQKVAQVIYLN